MRIVLEDPLDIKNFMEDTEMLKDFASCNIRVEGNNIAAQKIDLAEEDMEDKFLSHLEGMGLGIALSMYEVGRYSLLLKR